MVTLYAGGELGTVPPAAQLLPASTWSFCSRLGKRHIIVGMDNDKAGKKGVERVVKLVEEVSGSVGPAWRSSRLPMASKIRTNMSADYETLEKELTPGASWNVWTCSHGV